MKNFGWKGSFIKFLSTDKNELVNQLCLHIYGQTVEEAHNQPVEASTIPQIKAWYDCIDYLRKEVSFFQYLPGFLIFEYAILRSGARRPDALLFLPGEILVLEFKGYAEVNDYEYNQTSLYVRDLQHYHSAVQQYNLNVRGALVATSAPYMVKAELGYQVYILGHSSLRELVKRMESKLKVSSVIADTDFLQGTYQPLPSIIESARRIMRDQALPQIKSIQSSNYEYVIEEVKSIVARAKHEQSHHLVLISGVPGSGKTFVGLTLAHDMEKAVYLSGNGPLVDVLQDSLQNKTFVQALYWYKTDYLRHGKVPNDNIIIFDEAQRAWDARKMGGNQSEPDVIIEIAKHKPWSVVIGLIGEGQEIHTGEESGIGLWNEAILDKDFHVHARHRQTLFPNAISYNENLNLHLKSSLRTHTALTYFEWVEHIIAGDFDRSKALQKQLEKERFTIKVVDSLEAAKEYVREMYAGTDKTYGIVISSGIKNPKGVKIIPYSKRYANPKNEVAYFNYPASPYYCKHLDYAATEFQVQGLELDMAIVYWGDDLKWGNDRWKISYPKRGVDDPEQMKLNAYRVLLTRGRDGVIICQG